MSSFDQVYPYSSNNLIKQLVDSKYLLLLYYTLYYPRNHLKDRICNKHVDKQTIIFKIYLF